MRGLCCRFPVSVKSSVDSQEYPAARQKKTSVHYPGYQRLLFKAYKIHRVLREKKPFQNITKPMTNFLTIIGIVLSLSSVLLREYGAYRAETSVHSG